MVIKPIVWLFLILQFLIKTLDKINSSHFILSVYHNYDIIEG